jgi:hypothetical protein
MKTISIEGPDGLTANIFINNHDRVALEITNLSQSVCWATSGYKDIEMAEKWAVKIMRQLVEDTKELALSNTALTDHSVQITVSPLLFTETIAC